MDKTTNNKIPFGLKDGILLHVSEVVSGLACNCICPSCFGMLQANKGKSGKRTHYFSHDPSSNTEECRSAFETSIHLMAKQILEKHKNAMFPMLELSMSMEDDEGITHTEKIEVTPKTKNNFIHVELEKRLEDIRPDIVAYTSSNFPFLVEVAVTNFSGREKKEKFRKLGLHAIEIDLSDIDYSVTEDKLTKLVIEEFKNKKWLSNPDAIQAKDELWEKLKKKVDEANEKRRLIRQANSEKQQIKSSKNVSQLPQKIIVNPKVAQINRQYKKRHFVCESCRYKYFDVPIEVAPYTIETIKCPECGYPISTASP